MTDVYLIAMESLSRLRFQHVPAEITQGRKLIAPGISPIGANNPVLHPIGGQSELRFELSFFVNEESRENVIRDVRWLESITYNNGNIGLYEQVKLIWGKLFIDRLYLITNLDISLNLFGSDLGMIPQMAKVGITLTEDFNNSIKSDIRW